MEKPFVHKECISKSSIPIEFLEILITNSCLLISRFHCIIPTVDIRRKVSIKTRLSKPSDELDSGSPRESGQRAKQSPDALSQVKISPNLLGSGDPKTADDENRCPSLLPESRQSSGPENRPRRGGQVHSNPGPHPGRRGVSTTASGTIPGRPDSDFTRGHAVAITLLSDRGTCIHGNACKKTAAYERWVSGSLGPASRAPKSSGTLF